MTPTGNEIERFIQACSTGRIDLVKLAYENHGDSILGFKMSGTSDFKYPFYYSVRNGQMEVARFLRKIDPNSSKVTLSKVEAYHLMVDVLLNKRGTKPGKDVYHEMCVKFIADSFGLFDRETIVLAAVDSTLKRLDIEMYEVLIDKFHVNPRNFILRVDEKKTGFNIESPKYKTFMREIKLRSLLNDR